MSFNTREDGGEERRRELGDFLRTRRARIQPQKSDLSTISRRRTPGLRREEVAEMAGVSSSWYTWLEQGRDISPSDELLVRIGKVLRLNPYEISHLFNLAGRNSPELGEENHEEVSATLKQLVQEIIEVPAFVMGERFDFLVWNHYFTEQIMDLEQFPKERRNWLDMIFLENSSRKGSLEWREDAKRAVAEFRWSVGKQIGSPWVKELVGRLQKESPEFAQFWRLHEVQERKKNRILELQHEKFGRRSYIRSILIPLESEYLRLVILSPVSGLKKKK